MTYMTIAGQQYDFDRQAVEAAVEGELPEPVSEDSVVISGRRWPPKQVVAIVTGQDRAKFTTDQARRMLMRLGFVAVRHRDPRGRVEGQPAGQQRPVGTSAELTEALRPFIGKWVAIRGDEVLTAADSMEEIVSWANQHQERAQAMFRVPGSEAEIFGGR